MATLSDAGEEESGSEVPELSDPGHNLVVSGDRVDFDYDVGIFESTEPAALVAIIAVAEVDSRLLVAFPEGAWHRKKAKRAINPNSITKAVQVSLKPASAANREQPESSAFLKVWLGLLGREFEGQISFSLTEHAATVGFPQGADGSSVLPYAQALVAVAKDHYTFLSAESGGVSAPPGLGQAGDDNLQKRMVDLEAAVSGIQEGIKELLGSVQAKPSRPSALKALQRLSLSRADCRQLWILPLQLRLNRLAFPPGLWTR